MNQIFSNGMLADYAQGMPKKKQGMPASFLNSAAVDAPHEEKQQHQQKSRFRSTRLSKSSSALGHSSSNEAHRFGNGGYGAIVSGTKKNGADLSPEVYDEIFRLPVKVSSTSRFSDLPVLDPTAYYDEEDLFSGSTIRNGSASGVIYEDVFGGGLAAGPTYTDLNELLECFTASNSRSGGASSSSSGRQAQSPFGKTTPSFQHESDDDEPNFFRQSSRSESNSAHIRQSRSTNAFWQNFEEESLTKLTREHSGRLSKNGSKRFPKNGEAQNNKINDTLWQHLEPSVSLHSCSPISTGTDPVVAVQGSHFKNSSGRISHRKKPSSHDYTRDWLKSIDNFNSGSFLNRDSETNSSPKYKEDRLYEDSSPFSKGHRGARMEKPQGEMWLSLEDLKLKTSPSVTPPPARLPPLPTAKPNPVPPRMPERQTQGNGLAYSKVYANGVVSKLQESTTSTDSDTELNFTISPVNDLASGDKTHTYKGVNVCGGGDINVPMQHTKDKAMTYLKSESFNTKLELAEDIFMESAGSIDREDQVDSIDGKNIHLGKHLKESARDVSHTDHVQGAKKEKTATLVQNAEQKEELFLNGTTQQQMCCTKQKERINTLLSHLKHKEEDTMRNPIVNEHDFGTEENKWLETRARREEFQDEDIMIKRQTTERMLRMDEKQWKTITADNLEHKQDMVMNPQVAEHVPELEQKKRMSTAVEIGDCKENVIMNDTNIQHIDKLEQDKTNLSFGSPELEIEKSMMDARAKAHACIKEDKGRANSPMKKEGRKEEMLNSMAPGHINGTDQEERKTISFGNLDKEQLLEMNAAVLKNSDGAKQKERKMPIAQSEGCRREETVVQVIDVQAIKKVERKHASRSVEAKDRTGDNECSSKKEPQQEPEIIIQVTDDIQGAQELSMKDANRDVDAKNIKEVAAAKIKQNVEVIANSKPASETTDKRSRQEEDSHATKLDEENKSFSAASSEKENGVTPPRLNPNDPGPGNKESSETRVTDAYQSSRKEQVLNDAPLRSREEAVWCVREIEIDIRRKEREYELERQREREMEREKDRMGLGNKFSDIKGGNLGEHSVRLEKVAVNMREKPGKAPADNRSKMGFTGLERSQSELVERVSERGTKLADIQGSDEKVRNLTRFASGSQQRTLDRVAKALAEKKQRDLEAQRESAEKERISGSVNLEIKRWSSGKEGNLRALLSTLQYILWPESGWQTVSLTDIVSSAAVKKAYRKATLCVHPDKVQQKGATIRQKYVAEKVFDLLKDAWNKFNLDEQK